MLTCPTCKSPLIAVHHHDAKGGVTIICGDRFTSCPDITGRCKDEKTAITTAKGILK